MGAEVGPTGSHISAAESREETHPGLKSNPIAPPMKFKTTPPSEGASFLCRSEVTDYRVPQEVSYSSPLEVWQGHRKVARRFGSAPLRRSSRASESDRAVALAACGEGLNTPSREDIQARVLELLDPKK